MTFIKFLVPLMLTVHQMPPKNHSLTGISSGYDKISCQNEPQPITTLGFAGDCLGVDSEKKNSNKPGSAFTGVEILYNTPTKSYTKLMLCSGNFDSKRRRNTDVELEALRPYAESFRCCFQTTFK